MIITALLYCTLRECKPQKKKRFPGGVELSNSRWSRNRCWFFELLKKVSFYGGRVFAGVSCGLCIFYDFFFFLFFLFHFHLGAVYDSQLQLTTTTTTKKEGRVVLQFHTAREQDGQDAIMKTSEIKMEVRSVIDVVFFSFSGWVEDDSRRCHRKKIRNYTCNFLLCKARIILQLDSIKRLPLFFLETRASIVRERASEGEKGCCRFTAYHFMIMNYRSSNSSQLLGREKEREREEGVEGGWSFFF